MEIFDCLPPIEAFPCAPKAFACVPLDNAPSRLGFEADHETSVDPGSVWGSLIRDPQLPVIEKKDLNMKKDVRDVFLAVANGSFDGEYSLSVQDDPETSQKVFNLEIKVFCPRRSFGEVNQEDLYGTGAKEVLGSVHYRSFPCPVNVGMYSTATTPFRFTDAKYDNLLADDEEGLLKNRMLHYFIRQRASQLEYQLVLNLVRLLNIEYAKWRSYEEMLDTRLIMGDVSIASCQPLKRIHECFIQTAESLEGFACFLDAAELYEEAILKYGSDQSVDERCVLHQRAGIAFQRAGKYDDAERHVLLGWNYLCEGSEPVTVKSAGFNALFTSLSDLYSIRACAEQEQRSGTTEHRRIHQMIISLLYTAGFRAIGNGEIDEIFLEFLNHEGGRYSRKMLQRSIRNRPVEALKLLVKAGGHSDPSDFRKTLLLAQDRQNLGFLAQYPRREDEGSEFKAKSVRRRMRTQYTRGAVAPLVRREMCHQCETYTQTDVTFMPCPCRAVRYCSLTCQKAHWRVHKQYCTWYKENKKNAKSKG